MKISVKHENKTENLELDSNATVQDIFKKLKLNTETYIAKRGADIIIEQEKLSDKDTVELIKVISGG